ncbi:MAG TPA: hypothetical protein VG675_12860 [Bryobacteraceae bacterium]|nr:hypothetical protein [Bryobacteraceae bacterium]
MPWPRVKLRMKERRDVESMRGNFHRADLISISEAGDSHASGLKTRYVFRIHTVITVVAGLNNFLLINGEEPGARQQPDRVEAV